MPSGGGGAWEIHMVCSLGPVILGSPWLYVNSLDSVVGLAFVIGVLSRLAPSVSLSD